MVDADAMESILEGDLVNAKCHLPLNGIKCLNSNSQTQEEFVSCLTKVYDNIKKETNNYPKLKDKYKNNLQNLSLTERINIFLCQMKNLSLVGLDAYGYLIELKRTIFTKEELSSNFSINIIRNNKPNNNNKKTDIVAIITINIEGLNISPESTSYYILYPDNNFIKSSIYNIQELFDNGTFEYIRDNDPLVPNVNVSKSNVDNGEISDIYKKSYNRKIGVKNYGKRI